MLPARMCARTKIRARNDTRSLSTCQKKVQNSAFVQKLPIFAISHIRKESCGIDKHRNHPRVMTVYYTPTLHDFLQQVKRKSTKLQSGSRLYMLVNVLTRRIGGYSYLSLSASLCITTLPWANTVDTSLLLKFLEVTSGNSINRRRLFY
jgi:hypothetical protein